MRSTMAAMAAVTGTLALAASVVPAAQASQGGQAPADLDKPRAAERFQTTGSSSARSLAAAEPTVDKVTVNGGKAIVLGTTKTKTLTVSLTASHPSGITDAYIDLWHGTDVNDDLDGYLGPNEETATCTPYGGTTATCKLTITVDPRGDLYKNALAGNWNVTAGVLAGDGTIFWDDYYAKHRVQRYSKLTVNASPEPVKKGKTITATGKLSRANWETHDYRGYTQQTVKLQFRKKGATAYSTLKTVTSSSTGSLKSSRTASTDGYWRWNFAGTTTTPAIKSSVDFVDVR